MDSKALLKIPRAKAKTSHENGWTDYRRVASSSPKNCRCLLFPFRYQRAFGVVSSQQQASEFPAANGFSSKAKKSNLLDGVPINGGALTKCGEIPFLHRQNRRGSMTKPMLIRLRWLLDLSKLSKPKESTSQQTARQNNHFSLFCSPILQWILQSRILLTYLAAEERNHGHNKRQPLQKLSFFRNSKEAVH